MDILGLALLLLAGLVVGILLLAAYTARTLTHPPRRGYAFALAKDLPADPRELRFVDPTGAERIGARFEQWTFRSRGLELPVWEIEGCDADGPTVILTHGWGDSRVASLCRAPVLLGHCRRLILWDLPGHGEAPGSCSLGKHEGADLAALVEAIGTAGPAPILYGHSLGAGISIEVGAKLGRGRVAAVIAEAPYRRPMTPARNVLRLAHLPYRLNLPLAMLTIRPRFDRAVQSAGLRVPLLVLHGDADLVCPVADGSAIAAASPGARLVVIPGGGHLELFTDARFLPGVAEAVGAFLASSLKAGASKERVESEGTGELGARTGGFAPGRDSAR